MSTRFDIRAISRGAIAARFPAACILGGLLLLIGP
jgi:hypothetical protein